MKKRKIEKSNCSLKTRRVGAFLQNRNNPNSLPQTLAATVPPPPLLLSLRSLPAQATAVAACRSPHPLLPTGDDLPRALSAAVPATARHAGRCRRHPLAPAAASANEEAGTAGSGDSGLLAGRSGRCEGRGSRQLPSTPGTAPLSLSILFVSGSADACD
mgnify:CR=1 FL=1